LKREGGSKNWNGSQFGRALISTVRAAGLGTWDRPYNFRWVSRKRELEEKNLDRSDIDGLGGEVKLQGYWGSERKDSATRWREGTLGGGEAGGKEKEHTDVVHAGKRKTGEGPK